jgi:hypothetical protein
MKTPNSVSSEPGAGQFDTGGLKLFRYPFYEDK